MNAITVEGNKIVFDFPMATDGHVSWVMNNLLDVLRDKAKITTRLAESRVFPVLEARIGKKTVFSTTLIPMKP